MVVALYVICCFSFVAFIILSLSSFDRWTFVDKVMGGSEPSQQCEDILVLMFSSLLVTHPAGIGIWFCCDLPLLPSRCGFFFLFRRGVSLFGGFQHPSVDGCSTASCDFGALAKSKRRRRSWAHILLLCHLLPDPLPEPFCRHRKKTGMHLTYHISSNLLATNRHLQRVLKDGMRNENVKAQVFDGEGELRKRRQIKQSLGG